MKIARRLQNSFIRPPEPPAQPEPQPEPDDASAAAFLLDDPTLAGVLDQADARLAAGEAPVQALAGVPLDLLALASVHRPARWPALRRFLPEMPSAEVQLGMTGATGEVVLLEAAGFVRRVLQTYGQGERPPLSRARILDYGVGWARVARLLLKYAPAEQVCGVDAWERMLGMAEACRFPGPLKLIEAAPERLPFDEPFDLIYAFSIFTHLPEPMARAAVRAIHAALAPGGLFALTIRPAEIWRLAGGEGVEGLIARHRAGEFVYRASAGNADFGDASLPLSYIERTWTEFRVEGVEVNGADPYQTIVMLTPR